ncbi:SMI1/KNR4 family protein [Cryptosporangium aurantiacum]|uniref:SMI1 / KNR4 family (SUKH-1) n=1 Tax=Cryptosporangium aurantiacum TaxID=134849 RepID=A0A1M7TTP2_9ACTN|nr:SMI1/KNR4 family protein [Cryptosporangium aurantiacum]SHN74119.1 SMI1 / KNR4 family (SUKH-1) [Cryptosporangium aurantiacum]
MDEPEEWTRFLRQWSAEWLAVPESEHRPPPWPPRVAASGWLGYEPASEESIAAAEERLGVRLPPSYRAFLAVSDGWRAFSPFIWELLPSARVGWFREVSPAWLEAWDADKFVPRETGLWQRTLEEEGIDPEDLPDWDEDDFYDDGAEEWSPDAPPRLMARALQVSGDGDSAVLLLDPSDVGPDGEWAGYFLANWAAGTHGRHASFAELVRAEYATFRRLIHGDESPGA